MILYELKLKMKSTIIWSLAMFLMILISMLKGEVLINDPTSADIFSSLPKIINAMFGINSLDFTTPFGYYSVLYAYIVIALGTHAIFVAVGMFSNEEDDKTFEYILTKPIKRSKVAYSKMIATGIVIIIVNLLTSLGGYIGLSKYFSDNIDLKQQFFSISFDVFLICLILVGFSYMIMSISKKYNKAVFLTMMILFVFYMFYIIYNMELLQDIMYYLTPFTYLGPIDVFNNNVSIIGYFLAPISIILGVILLTNNFKNKEI